MSLDPPCSEIPLNVLLFDLNSGEFITRTGEHCVMLFHALCESNGSVGACCLLSKWTRRIDAQYHETIKSCVINLIVNNVLDHLAL